MRPPKSEIQPFKPKDLHPPAPSEWFQILAIISACLSSLTWGMTFSWTSPSIPRLIADRVIYDITLEEASYFTVLPPLGTILSCVFFSKLTDIIGRKRTLLLITIPHVASWLLIASSTSIRAFYAARFIVGLADACLFAALPIYIGEVATPKVRGTWGNIMAFFIYTGQLLINVIGSYFSVESTAKIALIVPIAFACSFAFMPETPYFYLMKGRVQEARESLRTLRWMMDVEEELATLKGDVERQMSESGTWRDVFTIKSNRKAVYAGIFLRASQQLSGIGALIAYNQYIFSKSAGGVSASTSAIIISSLTSVLNLCAGLVLDRIGRKRAYFVSVLLSGVVLLGVSLYFFLDKYYDFELWGWIPLAGMVVYIVVFSFGLGIVPTLMLGELFSTSIKGKGLCILNIVFALLLMSTTKLFHVLDSEIGLFAPFLMFALCCFASSVLTLYFVPDTEGKTLEEIQQSLKGKHEGDMDDF